MREAVGLHRDTGLGRTDGMLSFWRGWECVQRFTTWVWSERKAAAAGSTPRESLVTEVVENVPLPSYACNETMAGDLLCELTLVCPAFNEGASLLTLLGEWNAALQATGRSYEMVIVDDASTDGTAELLRSARNAYEALRVLRMERRSGQSAALVAGCMAARGTWVVTSDADLQNDPADLRGMLRGIDRFDMVCGWRKNRRDPWTKRFVSRFANSRRRRLLADGVHDSGCGLKVFRRVVIERILKFDGMHRFLPALARIEGFSVTEVPVNHRRRLYGRSNYWIFNRFRRPIEDLRGVAWYRSRQMMTAVREIARDIGEVSVSARVA